MEFTRNSVIALYLAGKSQPPIVHELKQLNVNKEINEISTLMGKIVEFWLFYV